MRISEALEAEGIMATLSGGAAVSIYTNNRYQSQDLDFVTSADPKRLFKAVEALGFVATESKRLYAHPKTAWLVEFPAGPLGFGNTIVDAAELEVLSTPWGQLRIIPPTLCVMDRLAAYIHWKDRQCWEQATWVAQNHSVQWNELQSWAFSEGITESDWQRFCSSATKD